MRSALLYLFLLLSFPALAQLNLEPRKISRQFFPDPDIEINTPAFAKKKGFTDYAEMMGFLRKLQKKHPEEMEIAFIGESQKGKKIPMVHLRRPGVSRPLRVWVQGGLHGNEPGSTESTFMLLNKLLQDSAYRHLLDKLSLAVVPMANIDGYERHMRDAMGALDLNRDQTKLTVPESVALKQAFSRFAPHVALDLHEYNPYRKHFAQLGTFGITSLYDVMFLYTGNLNVPESLRDYTEQRFVAAARHTLDSLQLRHHSYMSTTEHRGDIQFKQGAISPRSSATSYALSNSVSTLVEVRGVHLKKASFKRRVRSAFLVTASYLRTAYQHAEEVRAELREAAAQQNPVVVKSRRAVYRDSIRVLDLDTYEARKMEVTIRDALRSRPTLTRRRPQAYLIEKDQKALLEKLAILGLDIRYLSQGDSLPVQRYEITDYQQSAYRYEDIHVQEVSARLQEKRLFMPKGTAVVFMDQPRANLAIEVLEPEARNGFVSYEVLPTYAGDVLPLYRYLEEAPLPTQLNAPKQ